MRGSIGQHITVEMVVCCLVFCVYGVTIWNICLKNRKISVE